MQVNWIPFFSQTGNEIASIIENGIEPVMIVTNRTDTNYNEVLKKFNVLHFTEFNELFKLKEFMSNNIVTLHGFLRIIPEFMITDHMYNGHPGLITKYPFLKGKDPQVKAYNLKLPSSGSVIHAVTPEVDSGEVILSKEVSIEGLSLDSVFKILHDVSLDLWLQFFEGIYK